ncbi:hypothetical protein GCM10010452_66810 [Crossiella cryophila]
MGRVSELLGIGQVARRFGLRASALRYYDEIGLVPPAGQERGKRWYGAAELRRLTLVLTLQRTGMLSLEDIRRLLDSGQGESARTVLAGRAAELAERVRELRQAQEYLEHLLTCPREHPVRDCAHLAARLDGQVRELTAEVDFKSA